MALFEAMMLWLRVQMNEYPSFHIASNMMSTCAVESDRRNLRELLRNRFCALRCGDQRVWGTLLFRQSLLSFARNSSLMARNFFSSDKLKSLLRGFSSSGVRRTLRRSKMSAGLLSEKKIIQPCILLYLKRCIVILVRWFTSWLDGCGHSLYSDNDEWQRS